MRDNRKKNPRSQLWSAMSEQIHRDLPHLSSFFSDDERFIELRVKLMPDGTHLTIAKGYGPDGGPLVLFGAGYGFVGALLAADSAMQGNRWKVDTPWKGRKEAK